MDTWSSGSLVYNSMPCNLIPESAANIAKICLQFKSKLASLVVQACNSSAREAAAGGSLWAPGQPGLQRESRAVRVSALGWAGLMTRKGRMRFAARPESPAACCFAVNRFSSVTPLCRGTGSLSTETRVAVRSVNIRSFNIGCQALCLRNERTAKTALEKNC